ncbi:MAG: bifunctional hydroxymethylpyrimidine kinase/phosphomethylpyrimidine kinase [Thermodesulfovibrionales bacterium]|nr:bifunctional hydroxymethylpyrimidine kinase/phosphomethylpyrimidine kinase [Thermodesulfovibrionales bacterium]
MSTVLSIAGSDPTGGAGIQADLKVFRAIGLLGLSVPAVLTAQNTREVREVFPVYSECLRAQIECLLEDITPDALKTGMLYAKTTVDVVADAVQEFGLSNLVIDPVSVSSSGTSLMEDGMLDHLKQTLFPLAEVITPNIYEASLLSSIMIETPAHMQEAAKALLDMGPRAVVITGGHMEGLISDLFYDGTELQHLTAEKIGGSFHGTGCSFSAALAAHLAKGSPPIEAAALAHEFVHSAILKAANPGSGMKILGL